jgi:hypothetical protein
LEGFGPRHAPLGQSLGDDAVTLNFLAAFEEANGTTNASTVRAEANGRFIVQRADAAASIAAVSSQDRQPALLSTGGAPWRAGGLAGLMPPRRAVGDRTHMGESGPLTVPRRSFGRVAVREAVVLEEGAWRDSSQISPNVDAAVSIVAGQVVGPRGLEPRTCGLGPNPPPARTFRHRFATERLQANDEPLIRKWSRGPVSRAGASS